MALLGSLVMVVSAALKYNFNRFIVKQARKLTQQRGYIDGDQTTKDMEMAEVPVPLAAEWQRIIDERDLTIAKLRAELGAEKETHAGPTLS